MLRSSNAGSSTSKCKFNDVKTFNEAWYFSSPCLAALWAWTPQAGRGGSLMERSWAYLCLHEHQPRWDISQDSAERGLQPIQWQDCVRRSALLISGDYISQMHGLDVSSHRSPIINFNTLVNWCTGASVYLWSPPSMTSVCPAPTALLTAPLSILFAAPTLRGDFTSM